MIKIMIEENADASGWVLASTIGTLLQKNIQSLTVEIMVVKK